MEKEINLKNLQRKEDQIFSENLKFKKKI